MIVTALRIAVAAGALLAAGCSVEPSAPGRPTYQADVLPIFMARCVRCHGAPPGSDPTSTYKEYQIAPVDTFRIDVYADVYCDGGSRPCLYGAAQLELASILSYLEMELPYRMPPDPAPPLTKYQLDTIKTWAAEQPSPLEN